MSQVDLNTLGTLSTIWLVYIDTLLVYAAPSVLCVGEDSPILPVKGLNLHSFYYLDSTERPTQNLMFILVLCSPLYESLATWLCGAVTTSIRHFKEVRFGAPILMPGLGNKHNNSNTRNTVQPLSRRQVEFGFDKGFLGLSLSKPQPYL